jgi:thiol-disulfide isomerase/thioredoxin
MKNFFFFGLILLLLSCESRTNALNNKTQLAKDTTTENPTIFIVKDTSIFKSHIILNLYYHDSLSYGHPVLFNKLNNKVIITAPALFLQADDYQTPFLIYPGDTIYLQKDTNQKLTLTTANNHERNNELNFFKLLINKTGCLYSFPFSSMPAFKTKPTNTNEVNKILNEIDTMGKSRIAYLETYSNENPVSPRFKRIATDIINYTTINNCLLLYWQGRNIIDSNSYQQAVAKYIDTLNNMPFAENYMCYKALNNAVSISTTKFVENAIFDSADLVRKYAFIKEHFRGKAKNFLLCNITYKALNNKIPLSALYLKNFTSDCTDSVYRNIITKRLNDKNDIAFSKEGNYLLPATGKATQDIKTILSSYQNKIVLLDFWASWCSPCRAEMPASAKLKKLYIDKPVVFLYISTDNNKSDWQRASKEENLDNEANFLFYNSDDAPFTKQFKINTIPRYMLISKDGKMIDADAPRPSDPKLKELIDKHLKD